VDLPPTLNGRTLRALATSLTCATEPVLLVGTCAGLDPAAALGDEEPWQALRDVFMALWHGPPSAAWVSGPLRGGGLGLACACDRVHATSDATFALPELLLGLVPGAIGPAVRARIGPGGLRRLALRATAIDAEEALSMGLVDEVGGTERAALAHLRRLDRRAVRHLRRLTAPSFLAEVDAGITASRVRLRRAGPRLARWAAGEVPWST
jgi:enoyl-CoA hydratase/carnithine racemase